MPTNFQEVLKYYDLLGYPAIIAISILIGLAYYYYKLYKIEKDLYTFTTYVLVSIKEQILNPIQTIYSADESRYNKEFRQVLKELKNKSKFKGLIATLYELYDKYKMQNFLNLAVVLKSGEIKSSSYMLKKVTTLEKIMNKKEGSFGELIAIILLLSFLSIFIPYLVKLIFKDLDMVFLIWTFYFFLSFNLSISFPLLMKIYEKKRHIRYILLSLVILVHYLGLFFIIMF